jgi:ATP-dependent Zn protease
LKVHVAKVTLAANVDLDQIAGLTPGFTGANHSLYSGVPCHCG